MGKFNREKRVQKKTGNKKKKVSVEELVEQAQEALSLVQLETAVELYQQALLLEPQNTDLMDALADVCLQIGDTDLGLELLRNSTTLAPNANGIKWMYLGQLLTGPDSVKSYQTGISVFSSQLDTLEDKEKEKEYRREIASAYSAIAELYMTDLCMEKDAEQAGEDAIMKALEWDSNNIDVLTTLASFRISQCRNEDASNLLEQVIKRVTQCIEASRQRNIKDDILGTESEESEQFSQDLPPAESCISLVKLLIECSTTRPSLTEGAQLVIEHVLDYDDENPEVWYLFGVNANNHNPPDVEAAQFSFQQALTLLEKEMKENPEQAAMLQGLYDLVQESSQNVGKCQGSNNQPDMASAFAAVSTTGAPSELMECNELIGDEAGEDEEWSDMED